MTNRHKQSKMHGARHKDGRRAKFRRSYMQVSSEAPHTPERRHPQFFRDWARAQRVGNPTRKVILMSLAATAHWDTGYGSSSQEDLAQVAECTTRSITRHVAALEGEGLITRRRERNPETGLRGADGFLLLAPGVRQWPDGTPV